MNTPIEAIPPIQRAQSAKMKNTLLRRIAALTIPLRPQDKQELHDAIDAIPELLPKDAA